MPTNWSDGRVETINAQGGVNGRPLELVIEDTESDPSVAAPKARRLVESEGVDFLLGSNTSAVVGAVVPIAEELETVYFPTAGGALLTEPGKGNRYVFDFNTNVKQEVRGVLSFIDSQLDADTWMTAVVDYSWGWDNEQTFVEEAEAMGIEVANTLRVPLGEANWLAHLQGQIPEGVEGIYFANFGTDFLSFTEALGTLAPDIERIGANYVLSGQDLGAIPNGDGIHAIAGYPQFSSAINSEWDRQFREITGIDSSAPIHRRAAGQLLPLVHVGGAWASSVIEASGWESKDDTCEFITTSRASSSRRAWPIPRAPNTPEPPVGQGVDRGPRRRRAADRARIDAEDMVLTRSSTTPRTSPRLRILIPTPEVGSRIPPDRHHMPETSTIFFSSSTADLRLHRRPDRPRLSLIFGIMNIINMAHGDLFMLSAVSPSWFDRLGSIWPALQSP